MSSLLTQSGSGWTGYWGSEGFLRTAGRAEFERQLERRRGEELGPEFKPVEQGWCLGREAFRAELLAATVARVGAGHYGAERQAAGEVRAEGLVRAGLAALGWTEKELCGRAQGNRGKFKK